MDLILKKTLKLIFSVSSDSRLQLEHRQIAAGIIERTYKIYVNRLNDFQSFIDSESPTNLFHIEKSQNESNEIEVEELGDKKITSLETVRNNSNIHY